MAFITDFVSFAEQTRYEDIPERAIWMAKVSLADTIAVTAYGEKNPYAAAILRYVEQRPQTEEATAFGLSKKISATDAALVNGYLSHVDDYDEINIAGHIAVCLVPAALALAEKLHVSGKELLRAYCIGAELMFKLALRMDSELYGAGWCDFSVMGIPAAAAVSGILMELDAEQLSHAMAIAAGKASGVIRNFGTSVKPYYAGMSASAGIEAAQLAACGLRGNLNAFEGKDGYFNAFIKQEFPEGTFDWQKWDMAENGMVVKEHPCCAGNISTIKAVEQLLRDHGDLTMENVSHVHIEVDPASFACMAYLDPENLLEAKFALPFTVAKLLERDLTLKAWNEAEVLRPELKEFYKRFTVTVPEKWAIPFLHENNPCEVVITLNNGTELRAYGEWYICTEKVWEDMIGQERLQEKFIQCVAHRMDQDAAEEWFAHILAVDSCMDAAELMRTAL